MLISPQVRDFFVPIFRKHKSIFLLLLIEGCFSWVSAVIMPVLLKMETDQLMLQQWREFFSWELDGFQVFVGILLVIFLTDAISKLVQRLSSIFQDAQKDYLMNHIQLELFQKMKFMEVGKTMNIRFHTTARILEEEFRTFSDNLIRLPGGLLERGIQTAGITGIFAYFDIRLLFVVIASALFSYFVDRYAEIIRTKYEIHWKLSLGQKMYFYSDLFLRTFAQLAMNGAVKSTLLRYEQLLNQQIEHGLKKNWAELSWTLSGLFAGSFSGMLIKIIVGYGVFSGTHSIGMVALVVSTTHTMESVMRSIMTARKEYRRFRFSESSILLFLEMCEPIWRVAVYDEQIERVSVSALTFAYPNLSIYERKYLEILQKFMQGGGIGKRWIDELFWELVKSIEDSVGKKNPIILRDLSLEFQKGKIYGLVGKNWAGKSTLMQLLVGFFREYEGNISYNSENIQDWMPELLAKQASFLTQEPFFMNWGATIRDNLFFGVENPSEEQMWHYLEKFWLAEKIRKSPKWIDAEIGGDLDFSWWERQIIAFIRLLLQDRAIIIMDEGTNQLDAENEIAVMDELFRKKDQKIIIFITHRMSTISKADTIYCLEWGKICATGSHKELLSQWDNPYSRFYRAQVLHDGVV